MDKNYILKDQDGNILNVSLIGCFKIPDLNKKYAIYSLQDDNKNNKMGYAMIGEIIKEDNKTLKVIGIKEAERDIVLAYYNEISKQLGDNKNEAN